MRTLKTWAGLIPSTMAIRKLKLLHRVVDPSSHWVSQFMLQVPRESLFTVCRVCILISKHAEVVLPELAAECVTSWAASPVHPSSRSQGRSM